MKQKRDLGTQKASVIQKIFIFFSGPFRQFYWITYEGYTSHSYAYSTRCTRAHELAQPCPEPEDPSGQRGPGRCLSPRRAQSQVSTWTRLRFQLTFCWSWLWEMPFNSSGQGGNSANLNEFTSKKTLNWCFLCLRKGGKGFWKQAILATGNISSSMRALNEVHTVTKVIVP